MREKGWGLDSYLGLRKEEWVWTLEFEVGGIPIGIRLGFLTRLTRAFFPILYSRPKSSISRSSDAGGTQVLPLNSET